VLEVHESYKSKINESQGKCVCVSVQVCEFEIEVQKRERVGGKESMRETATGRVWQKLPN
jgi:hypothetical protein